MKPIAQGCGMLLNYMQKINMLAYVIKIKNAYLRNVLLLPVFLVYYAGYIMKAALPVSLGGHPNASRLMQLDFYLFPLAIFVSALKGHFV